MDWSDGYRNENSHVAQQRRRDKLRLLQLNMSSSNYHQARTFMEEQGQQQLYLPHNQMLNQDHLMQIRKCNSGDQYNPSSMELSSQMVNFDANNSQGSCNWNNMVNYPANHLQISPLPQGDVTVAVAVAGNTWEDNGNEQELVLLPNFSNQLGIGQSTSSGVWMMGNNNVQGLSLTLSSTFPEGSTDLRPLKSDFLSSSSKPFFARNSYEGMGNDNNDMVRDSTGPLGPFTGYATILRSSKFLKPAQLLLHQICNVSEIAKAPVDEYMIEFHKGSLDSEILQSSNQIEGLIDGLNENCKAEFHQKKAKLLLMLDEVCRRYKQYEQQMQMAICSFESVAGLSAATPYIMSALKTISRHFKCLKNAILDQIQRIRKTLWDDRGVDTSSSRLKMTMASNDLGFFENRQHAWRPQRGLPERAVTILRAWLFDHFLHPYPTDTDKHMLATQTGLSRNQVSNWFINARVRVWKPMVEEIHMLETKGLGEANGRSHEAANPEPECLDAVGGCGEACPLMGFMSYPPTEPDHGPGPGSVSLTLGLRQGRDMTHHQHLQQQQVQRYGSRMIHEFVG